MRYWLIILLLIPLVASAAFERKITNTRNQVLIRIENPDNKNLMCKIWNQDFTYIKHFRLNRLSVSQWYFQPNGIYFWECR